MVSLALIWGLKPQLYHHLLTAESHEKFISLLIKVLDQKCIVEKIAGHDHKITEQIFLNIQFLDEEIFNRDKNWKLPCKIVFQFGIFKDLSFLIISLRALGCSWELLETQSSLVFRVYPCSFICSLRNIGLFYCSLRALGSSWKYSVTLIDSCALEKRFEIASNLSEMSIICSSTNNFSISCRL